MSKTIAVIVLIVVILGSWVWLYRSLRPGGIELEPYEALGRAAALETSKLLQGKGRLLLVDAHFAEYALLAPINEAQIRSFTRSIRKAGLQLAATEKVAIEPPSMGRNGIFMSPGQLSGLLDRYADVEAIVLFVGLAGPGDLKRDGTRPGKPAVILVGNYEPYCRDLVARGVIQLAIVPRSEGDEPDAASAEVGSPEWFERHYQVLTPDRISELVE